jgi:hypothetical protein
LAELVALGLLVVEGLVILGYVAAGIAYQVQLSDQGVHAWGFFLSDVSGWSVPWAVAVSLLGPLALVAWIGRRDPDEDAEARTGLVLRLELVLAALTILGGSLSIVGRAVQLSPPQQWSAFFYALGSGVGSVVLGLLGVVVVKWLADDMQFELLPGQRGGDPAVEQVY